MKDARHRIGIDLDNTLVCYDALFHRLACEHGLIPPTMLPHKQSVRDYIRQHAGDIAWQRLQALAYGTRMGEACLFPQALQVLRCWKEQGHQLAIVSHKTRTSAYAPEENLHTAAVRFLKAAGVLDCIDAEDVYFLPDRAEKIATIRRLGCSIFVDDLPEVFADATFPPAVCKVLLTALAGTGGVDGANRADTVLLCRNWEEVDAQTRALLSS